MSAVIPVEEGRPAVVQHDGCRVYISVHDAEFRRQYAAWKHRRADAHPDKGGSLAQFRRIETAYRRWLDAERAWYVRYDMAPPVREKPARVADPVTSVTSLKWRLQQLAALLAHSPKTSAAIGAMLGCEARTLVWRARRAGAPIITMRRAGGTYYALEQPWQPQRRSITDAVRVAVAEGRVVTRTTIAAAVGRDVSANAITQALCRVRRGMRTGRC